MGGGWKCYGVLFNGNDDVVVVGGEVRILPFGR